jgi:YHS domain-containing protein
MGGFLLDIVEFVALLLFLRALVRNLRAVFGGSHVQFRVSGGRPAPRPQPQPRAGETSRDPICGMFVSTELPHRLRQGSETIYFCSPECLAQYQKDPTHVVS